MIRSEHVKIRCTKQERCIIESYAKINKSTISDVIRNVIQVLKEDVSCELKQA